MAYQPKYASKDFINCIVEVTEKYVRSREVEFKVVADLSFFLGRLEAIGNISWKRNMLCLYEEEFPVVWTELSEYLKSKKENVLEVFPNLKEPVETFLSENPFDYTTEFDEHIEFESIRKDEIEQILLSTLRPF